MLPSLGSTFRLSLAVAGVLLLCAALFSCLGPRPGKPTREGLEQELQRELPIGSSTAQIETYLRRQGYEFTFVTGAEQGDETGHYTAWVRDVERWFYVNHLRIRIYVDNQGEMRRVVVDKVVG